ncbi:hypothetical protein [Enterococcus pallens]|uniref:Right handed beta helix domain-containing protein n=1 Tax=Enterococcus pallens ATCC BAA-351 TaxID=1158607 RepID=R2SLR1_9ENTE|nr:hypothetical protein [Enterococcus pallens]EOH93806.1 hypothetical protein UAU_02502 [Enterococcus pallens ATCC BAA-351]EOU24646.1 hypothetical protein I588_00633 [Enterococcus pallens ATCC BAA-351]OJG79533.1 hypothetical protein RV10_GL000660 [Enterococcus pallens]
MTKKRRIIFIVVCLIIIVGICSFVIWLNHEPSSPSSDAIETETKKKQELKIEVDGTNVTVKNAVPIISDFDNREGGEAVIPDFYNTGADLTQPMLTPEYYVQEGYLEKRENDYVMKLQSSSFDEETLLFENIFFADLPLFLANNNQVSPTGTIEFRNCYFSEGINLTNDIQKQLIFTNCDFLTEPVSASNSQFYHCKFYESYGDALQIGANVILQDSYIFNNGLGDPEKYHSDGIQIAGFGHTDAHNISIDNVRIEMPRVYPHYGHNSAMLIKMDMANGYDMSFKNMILNGGAFTLYLVPTDYEMKDLHFENLRFGNTSEWGPVYTNESLGNVDGWAGQEVINCDMQSTVYVSSVRKEDGSFIFCATNETEASRKLRVETDLGVTTIEVPPVLTVKQAQKKKASYEAMNIDLPFEVAAGSWIKIYDGKELIRYKNFAE